MGRKRAPRRGLVLGAGGVLGSAWLVGALRAVELETGQDVRDYDLVLGTSAGSVIAALIALGVSTEVMANSERGVHEPGFPVLDYRDLGASLPPRPRMRMGSPRLLTTSALHPRRTTPMVALAALLPQGRGEISAVGDLVAAAAERHSLAAEALDLKRSASLPPGARPRRSRRGRLIERPVELDENGWPRSPLLRIVAMDFDSGGRVLFGADGAPVAPLPRAVMASCAIPGWYAPVEIGGRRFVDGATRSPASLDLLADSSLTEVLVLAPACSFDTDRPRGAVARLERQIRRAATRRLAREIELVEAAGTKVTVLCPGPEDLEVMGGNFMDLTRRAEVFETSLRTTAEAVRAAGLAQTLSRGVARGGGVQSQSSRGARAVQATAAGAARRAGDARETREAREAAGASAEAAGGAVRLGLAG